MKLKCLLLAILWAALLLVPAEATAQQNVTYSQGSKQPACEVTAQRMEHNVLENGQKGMNVVMDFSAANAQNREVVVVLYVTDSNGDLIHTTQKAYSENGGGSINFIKVCQPPYETTLYKDLQIFVPYAAFNGLPSGNYRTRTKFYVRDKGASNLALCNTAPDLYFTYTPAVAQAPAKPAQQQQQVLTPAGVMQQVNNVLANPGASMKFDFSDVINNPNYVAPPSTPSSSRRSCYACKGTGRIEKHLYTPGGGFFYCTECHRERPNGHYHSSCSSCYGTGWIGN